MSQVKGQVIRQRQDRKCPWAAILITKISVADNHVWVFLVYADDFRFDLVDFVVRMLLALYYLYMVFIRNNKLYLG